MIWARAFVVWLTVMTAEVVHGVLRTLFLVPLVGDFRARQLGVLTGSVLILAIAFLCAGWIRARPGERLAVGAIWVCLTLAFEVVLGRLLLGYPWERLWSDYDVLRGGLMPFGLLVMGLAPAVAGRRTDAIRSSAASGGKA